MIKKITLCIGAACLLLSAPADARSFRNGMLPNAPASCNTCHTSGGGTPRNAFGLAIEALVTPGGQEAFWDATLAAQDSDGDGVTNGDELGDPDGDGVAVADFSATNPGDETDFTMTQDPGDGDGGTSVELPMGDVGPIGLDLDATAGDQMVRQTPTNPSAGDQVDVDIFITGGAMGQLGFNVTLTWDPAVVTFVSHKGTDLFQNAAALTTPSNVTSEDSTVDLSFVFMGNSASSDAGTAGTATFTINEGFSGVTTINLTAGSIGSGAVEIGPGAAFVVLGGAPEVELTPAQAANFDGDATVGFGDFLVFAGGFGKSASDPEFDSRLDLDGDGTVGFTDFLQFAAVFGQTL